MENIPQDLITRAAAGDMQAFETLYDASCGFVYSVALRIVRNQHDAEEVTQDVFMRLYHNLKDFGFRSSFKTWAYRITVNSAINAYRKRSKENKHRTDAFDAAIDTVEGPPDTHTALEAEDTEHRIQSLLGQLPPEQRSCVILREIEGLSYKEMAETLRININTVRTRLKRAREALIAYHKGR